MGDFFEVERFFWYLGEEGKYFFFLLFFLGRRGFLVDVDIVVLVWNIFYFLWNVFDYVEGVEYLE